MRNTPAIRPAVQFGYITGWRIPSEVLPLQWRHVDFEARVVRLDPHTTKNDEGRTFPFTDALEQLLEAQKAEHDRLKAEDVICPWVFNRTNKKVKGKRITTFIKAFRAACTKAGCPRRIPHDLRRTAVRNLVRAGIPERVAVQMTGHKTRSVFERYNIVSECDLVDAARKLNAFEPAPSFTSSAVVGRPEGLRYEDTPPAFLLIACCLFVLLTLGIRAGSSRFSPAVSALEPGAESVQVPADCGAEPCDAVVRGRRAFFDRELHGLGANGRACADCHMATDHFQLSPADVEARFRLLELRRRGDPNADDPLFRPIDADDFRVNGETAGDFSNLRQHGLVRVTLPLPSNIKLVDPITNAPSSETFVDVWRAVPTVNDVNLTGPDGINPWPRGPNNTGGYQLDARVTTLQEQALGALINHAQIQSLPPQQLLDDLASFQRVLFTNHRIRELSDAIGAGDTSLPDPDPPLSELEQQGKAVFVRACAQCHGGPTQTTPQAPVIRFHSIFSQCPRPVDTATPARFALAPCPDRLARNARTYEITVSVPTPCPPPAGRVTPCPLSPAPGVPAPPLPAGARIRRTSSDPGRALLTGFVGGAAPTDDWEKLDIPALRGISQTAPYFHNNPNASTWTYVIYALHALTLATFILGWRRS